MPVNQENIGKTYDAKPRTISPQDLEAYALATDDHNPLYSPDAPHQIGSPMFPVRPLLEVLFGVLFDLSNGIDMTRLVHGEQEMVFHRPVKPGAVVVPRGSLASVEVKEQGEIVTVEQRLQGEDGTLYTEATSRMFIKAKGAQQGEKKRDPQPQQQVHEAVHTMSQHVALDQTERYAQASGDHNPIHLDETMAKAAGLPGRILHGLCTMAFATRALVEGPCGGNPEALKAISVRFARPVTLGQDLSFSVRPLSEKTSSPEAKASRMYTVEVRDAQGRDVLTQVRAKVREDATSRQR